MTSEITIYPFWGRDKPNASAVWEYFGFRKNENGELMKDVTYCRICTKKLSYVGGNTSNMKAHLTSHHPDLDLPETPKQQEHPKAILSKKDPKKRYENFSIEGASKEIFPYWGRNKPRASAVWNYFGFKKDAEGSFITARCFCMLCPYSLNYCGNTTNMMLHISRSHPECPLHKRTMGKRSHFYNTGEEIQFTPLETDVQEPSVDSSNPELSTRPEPVLMKSVQPNTFSSMPNFFIQKKPFPKEKGKMRTRDSQISASINNFLAQDMMPLKVVRGKGFQSLVAQLDSSYTIQAPDYYKTGLNNLHFENYTQLKEDLNAIDCATFTVEQWAGITKTPEYITVGIHFVSKAWKHVHAILKTEILSNNQASGICHVLEKVFSEWGLTDYNLTGLLSANKNIREALLELEKESVTCFGDIMNHAVIQALQSSDVVESVERIKEMCSYIASNQMALGQLEQELFPYNLAHPFLNHASCWFDVFNMLVWALKHKEVLRQLCGPFVSTGILSIEDTDWYTLNEVVNTIQPLHQVIQSLCTELNPTASIILPILHQLQLAIVPVKSDSQLVKSMKHTIQNTLDNFSLYQDEKVRDILHLATVLDPRFKNLWFLSKEEKYSVYQNLKDTAIELAINQEDTQEANVITLAVDDEDSNSEIKKIKIENVEEEDSYPSTSQIPSTSQSKGMASLFGINDFRKPPSEPKSKLEKEVFRYKDEDQMTMDGDPFLWWREREVTYPVMSQLAKQYLSMPACSLSPKLLFTQEGVEFRCKRAALSDDEIDRSLFLYAAFNNNL